jgi:hypothetical protein
MVIYTYLFLLTFVFLLQLTRTDKIPRNLVVCFSRMIHYEAWRVVLAAMEFYKYHGVDLMVIPIASVLERLYTVLQAYEKTGQVRLKPAPVVPKFVSYFDLVLT